MRITPPTHSPAGSLNETGEPTQSLELPISSVTAHNIAYSFAKHIKAIRTAFPHFSFFLLKNSSLSTPFFLPSSRGSILPPPVFHFHLHSSVSPILPPPGRCCTLLITSSFQFNCCLAHGSSASLSRM